MNKLKDLRLPIKESYLLIIIIIGIISLCMYSSFALFSLEKTSTKDIVTMKAASDIQTNLSIYEYKEVKVSAGDNTSIMLNVNNNTGGSIYYGVFYEMVSPNVKTDDIGIYKIDWSKNATSGSITNGSTLPVELLIVNNSSSEITINIGVAGSSSNELGLTEGKTLITETFDTGKEPDGSTSTPTTTVTDYNFDMTKTSGETITLAPGTHKLEAWGASGVYSGASPTNSHPNGYGGYASGTLTLTEALNVTLYIGGSPNSNSDVNYGGWNGGGSSYKGSSYNDNGSGGGATDICLTPSTITLDSYQRYVRTSASYLSRILVAGGGGGGRSSNTVSNGGYFNTSGSNTYVGTLTGAGSSSSTSETQAAGFGYGATSTRTSDDYAGGGGGWYGGGSNGDSYGGGGSSFVWSADTASSVPSGYTPSTKYQMTNVVYNKGNSTMPSSTSTTGTETGHFGNGHIRITSTVGGNTAPSIDTSSISIEKGEVIDLKTKVTCKDNGSGCKIVLVKPSTTKGLTTSTTAIYVLEDNSGNRYKYKKQVNIKVNAANFVKNLDYGSTGNSGSGVYKVRHSAIAAGSSATGSTIPASTDYRYYGASPNNYVCLDMEGSSSCPDKHLYRIIGSIYEENAGQNLLKVIKATPLTDGTTSTFSWDYTNSGSYTNIWATVTSGNYSNSLTSGSQLMKLLNSGDWWNGKYGWYYNRSTISTTVDFTNYKLSDKAKSYVTTSRYYLSGYATGDIITTVMYGYERGTNRYDTNRPLYWDGNVGLMYPSDFGYAAGNTCATETTLYYYNKGCYQKDWLNDTSNAQWLLSLHSGNSNYAFYLTSAGLVFGYIDMAKAVRPVFYLTSSTTITGGSGTETDPYIISK